MKKFIKSVYSILWETDGAQGQPFAARQYLSICIYFYKHKSLTKIVGEIKHKNEYLEYKINADYNTLEIKINENYNKLQSRYKIVEEKIEYNKLANKIKHTNDYNQANLKEKELENKILNIDKIIKTLDNSIKDKLNEICKNEKTLEESNRKTMEKINALSKKNSTQENEKAIEEITKKILNHINETNDKYKKILNKIEEINKEIKVNKEELQICRTCQLIVNKLNIRNNDKYRINRNTANFTILSQKINQIEGQSIAICYNEKINYKPQITKLQANNEDEENSKKTKKNK